MKSPYFTGTNFSFYEEMPARWHGHAGQSSPSYSTAFGVSRVSMLRRFDFAPGLFSRFLCSRCALSRARQEGAVPYGMAGPHPGVGQATPLARSITWVGNI